MQLLRKFADFAWQHNMKGLVNFMRRVKSRLFRTADPHASIQVNQLEDKLAFLKDRPRPDSGLRILEIGPKSGAHSRFIDRFFEPGQLVMLERPGDDRQETVNTWLKEIKAEHEVVYSDLFMADKLLQEEPFDIVFCMGVIYHNVEYFKTFNILHRLLKPGGVLVLGTVLSYDRKPNITLQYSKDQLYDFSRPSKSAMKLVLAMTGFKELKSFDLPFPNQRGLFVYEAGPLPPHPPGSCAYGGSTI